MELRASAVAVLCALGLPALAATYDAGADWNPPANPSGAWSYRAGASPLPYYGFIPNVGAGGYAPTPVQGAFLPVFFKSAVGGADILVHSYDPFNGQAAGGEAVLAWTAPEAARIDVSGYAYYAHVPLQRSSDVILRLGGTVLSSDRVAYDVHQDFDHRLQWSFTGLAVAAGDELTVTFQRSAGFAPGTVTAVDLHVRSAPPVPEPSTAALLALGLLVAPFVRRARR